MLHAKTRFGALLLLLLVLAGAGPIYGPAWGDEVSHPRILTGTSAQLLGPEDAARFAETLGAEDDVVWKVHVPDTYDPAVPAGLLVYISPTSSGRIPTRWKKVMREQNLIYIGADKSGNQTDTLRRMLFALMAPIKAAEVFQIDPQRIYVSGFSGGGRTASYLTSVFPDAFVGGIYICGVEYGTLAPVKPAFHDLRHVLITGQRDFNRQPTKASFAAMQAGGADQVHLMDIPNFEHELPRARHLTEAIAFLDNRPAED